jgi:hypothetical protein
MGPRSVVSVLRASAVALLVLLVSAPARADRHTGAAGAGGGRGGRSALWGATLSGDWIPKGGEWPCGLTGRAHKCTLGLAGEIGWATGDHEGDTLTQYVFQAGPRFSWNTLFDHKLQLFAVAMAGATVEKYRGESKSSFSTALGFGADVPISSEDHPVWVLRGQATWNWIDNDRSDDSYWQVGLSLMYRFGEKHTTAQRTAPASK